MFLVESLKSRIGAGYGGTNRSVKMFCGTHGVNPWRLLLAAG